MKYPYIETTKTDYTVGDCIQLKYYGGGDIDRIYFLGNVPWEGPSSYHFDTPCDINTYTGGHVIQGYSKFHF